MSFRINAVIRTQITYESPPDYALSHRRSVKRNKISYMIDINRIFKPLYFMIRVIFKDINIQFLSNFRK